MTEMSSLESKYVHMCSTCYGIGGFEGKEDYLVCSRCGKRYTTEEWTQLTKIRVPLWRLSLEVN